MTAANTPGWIGVDLAESRDCGAMFVSAAFIRHNWPAIKADPDNPWPDIETADEWIAKARAGEITMFGFKVVIQDRLPPFWTVGRPGR